RQSLHLKLGDTIEQMYQDTIEEHCSELAHHYGASSNPGKAVKYLHGAGLQAWNRGALKEAELYWRRGIAALSTKPETPERIEREFFLQLDLLVLLSSTSGYASGEAEEALERLKQISEQLKPVCASVGDSDRLIFTLSATAWQNLFRGEVSLAQRIADQVLE